MPLKWRRRDGTIQPCFARAQMFYNEEHYTSFFIICVDAMLEKSIPRSLAGYEPMGSIKNRIEELPQSPEDEKRSSDSESEGEKEGLERGQQANSLLDLFVLADSSPSPPFTPLSSPSSPFTDSLVEVLALDDAAKGNADLTWLQES